MAKFLTTTRISAELEDIIKNADDYLYLISPFLKVSKRLKELLESKSRSVNIHVIYGKSELQPDEGEWRMATLLRWIRAKVSKRLNGWIL